MSGPENFFVKDGYACNHAAVTYESTQSGEYWTPTRIRNAAVYQHHVYELAARIARARGSRSGVDIGCGAATKARSFLAPVLEQLVLIDQPTCAGLAATMLPDARFIGADLEVCDVDLPGKFDLIVCADVLEHLVDPRACLEFARRHLADGGVAVFSTPERDALRGRDCDRSLHDAHVREWNLDEFRRLLEWAGFAVIDQPALPAARLSPAEELLRVVVPARLRPRRWRHCQAALCTVREPG